MTCFHHKLFSYSFTIFRPDRVGSTKSRDGGFLTAISSAVRTFTRTYDLQFYDACVCIELSTQTVP